MNTMLLLGGLLALAGPSFAEKTGTARPALSRPPMMEGCDATELRDVKGSHFSEVLKQRAQAESGAAIVRVYGTGDAITQDARIDRLNLELDANNRVITAACF